MTTKERAELRGKILGGRYRVGHCIGLGGTGVVFRAEDLVDPAAVVVKTLRPMHALDPDLVRRMWRELEVAKCVRHPGIVPVLDTGTLDDGSPYLVMPMLRGRSLLGVLRRERFLSPGVATAITIRVAAILHAVHGEGYVHRDVKPEHVMLERNEDGTLQVHLLDFGVCAAATAPADERARERGRVYGTPSYASPEQASGDPYVDPRADVYGCGAMLYELVTGLHPFTAGTIQQLLRRILDDVPVPVARIVPGLPEGLDAVIHRALARDRAERYATTRALARALEPFAHPRVERERDLSAVLAA
jgi:serine/threonine-protein kinase